ncbi:MAG: hypothetical protein ACI906_004648 [Candidatus Latescibacterota bacterium]|jgi:hypothetical protein
MPIQNITRARQNAHRHPWAQRLVETWRQQTAYALQQDRSFFERMIPVLTPWPEYGQNCPACVGRLSSMGETGLYQWDIRDPEHLTCTYCNTQYPNADYPETGAIKAARMGQEFTFYLNDNERAHPEDTTGTHAYRWVSFPVHTSFSGVLRSKQGRWCLDQVLPLAQLYALTEDPTYATCAAWIMDITASRYAHWLYHSYDGTYADCPPAEVAIEMGRHPRGGQFAPETIISAFDGRHQNGEHSELFNGFWGAGRFACSGGDAGILLPITLAYDLIRDAKDSGGQPILSAEMDQRISRDLILAGCDDMERWNEINNKCPPARALSALVGRLFDRPESVRRAIAGFEALLEKGFHTDGFCTESPSYSDMFLNLMRQIPDLLAGYSDPEDHAPEQGGRLVDFDPYHQFSRYRLALENMLRMLDPNRKYPVIGDTHFGGGLQGIHAEVLTAHYGEHYAALLEQTLAAPLSEAGDEYALWHRNPDIQAGDPTPLPRGTEFFPAWKVGVLRGGHADGHTAFYFNASALGNHRHTDTLGISYIAHHSELAADRGYIWDDPRGVWTKSTHSHHLVIVDGEKQNHPERDSKLELFGRGPSIEVVQSSAHAYAQCSQYQRTCALVQRPDGGTYAVDFFRVQGGNTHHYSFHCNGDFIDVRDVEFSALDGANPTLEEWLKWAEQPRAAQPQQTVQATWQYEETRMDLHLLNDIDRLLLADTPGWRSCHGSQLNAKPVQQILAERSAEKNLASHYAAVMVPYQGETSPVLATRLLGYDEESGALAVEVSLTDRTDYILSANDYSERNYGPVTMAGHFAFLSVDAGGQPLQAYLLDGTHLSYGDSNWTLPSARTERAISSIEGQTLQLEQPLPDNLPNADFLLIGDTGYDIESIDGATIRVRDYPPVADEVVTLLHALSWTR